MPYRNEGSFKQERGLLVQVRVTGVEADSQKEKTKTVKSTGRWWSRTANDGWRLRFNVTFHSFGF